MASDQSNEKAVFSIPAHKVTKINFANERAWRTASDASALVSSVRSNVLFHAQTLFCALAVVKCALVIYSVCSRC